MSSKWKASGEEKSPEKPVDAPKKFILVTSREVTKAEKAVLGRTYKTIIEYDTDLHGILDIAKVAFDMLIVDGFPPENHRFLEIIKPKLAELAIMPVVLKNGDASKALAEELGAALVTRIEDLDSEDLPLLFTKPRLTKLMPKWKRVLLACFRLLQSA